jgi:hypothetical protein
MNYTRCSSNADEVASVTVMEEIVAPFRRIAGVSDPNILQLFLPALYPAGISISSVLLAMKPELLLREVPHFVFRELKGEHIHVQFAVI